MNGLDGAVDAGSDGIQMAVDLRVVGTFVTEGVDIPHHAKGHQPQHDGPDEQEIDPPARRGLLSHGRLVLVRRGSLRGSFGFDFSDHLDFPFKSLDFNIIHTCMYLLSIYR